MTWLRSFLSHIKILVLFIAVIVLVTEFMNYLYVDDTTEFTRCMMYEFYEDDTNIDRLYLGSSHVFCDIDPTVLDEINGENNFNLSTHKQQMITSYYLLKEADKKHNIRRVYLDLFYLCTNAGIGNFHEYQSLSPSWTVINQMRPSVNKLSYMLHLSDPAYYYLTFLPFMRYREKLFSLDYISEIVGGKQTEEWKNHAYSYTAPDGSEVIKSGGKGFRIYYGELEYGDFCMRYEEGAIAENPMTQESLEYLEKIVEYCEEHDIELTWIVSPVTDLSLTCVGGYDNFVRQVTELAEQHHIPFYDFNLCRREYLDVSDSKYWFDVGHLNAYGAEIYSEFLGDFLLAQEQGKETYQNCFYDSYEEKIDDLQGEIFGLQFVKSGDYGQYLPDVAQEDWEEYVIYLLRFATSPSEDSRRISFRVRKDTGTGEPEEVPVMQGETENYIVFSSHEHGELFVEAELEGAAASVRWNGIPY